MKENYYLGLYWGQQEIDWNVDIKNILITINLLCNRNLEDCLWYNTKKTKEIPLTISSTNIIEILKQGANVDYLNNIIPDLGYRFALKTHKNYTDSNILSVNIGATNNNCTNCVIYDYNKKESLNIVNIISNFIALIKLWQPNFAVISNQEFDIFIDNISKSTKLKLGLLNYHNNMNIQIPPYFELINQKTGKYFKHNSFNAYGNQDLLLLQ